MAPRMGPDHRPQNGEIMRATRYARRLSLTQLAKLARVSAPTISKAEHEVCGIEFERLERIAKALGVPVTDLLREPYKTRVSTLGGSNGDDRSVA